MTFWLPDNIQQNKDWNFIGLGIYIDGKRVYQKRLLLGLYTIEFGDHKIILKSDKSTLILNLSEPTNKSYYLTAVNEINMTEVHKLQKNKMEILDFVT